MRANGSDAGGIAGFNTGTITGAQGGGTINAARNAGGIAGRSEGTIQNGLAAALSRRWAARQAASPPSTPAR